eukprot:5473927-Alexandrium_andersonii.AAC.1
MSASLVGSEMCIRDRSESLHASASAVARPCPGPGGHVETEGDVDEFAPVSYTHLTLPTICSV